MAAFTRLARRIALAVSVAAVAAIAVAAPVKTAAADGWRHGGYSRGGVYFNFGGPIYTPYYYRPRPVYYYPPAPVYYAPPPPVYYQPAPVYGPVYGPPSVSFGISVPIR
jgi:hypothetical protein